MDLSHPLGYIEGESENLLVVVLHLVTTIVCMIGKIPHNETIWAPTGNWSQEYHKTPVLKSLEKNGAVFTNNRLSSACKFYLILDCNATNRKESLGNCSIPDVIYEIVLRKIFIHI